MSLLSTRRWLLQYVDKRVTRASDCWKLSGICGAGTEVSQPLQHRTEQREDEQKNVQVGKNKARTCGKAADSPESATSSFPSNQVGENRGEDFAEQEKFLDGQGAARPRQRS
jgi:hypothetical protein